MEWGTETVGAGGKNVGHGYHKGAEHITHWFVLWLFTIIGGLGVAAKVAGVGLTGLVL